MSERDVASNTTFAPVPDELSSLIQFVNENTPVFRNQMIITKTVALLSAMGSAYIVFSMVVRVKDAADRRKKLHRTFDRLLLCLCISDFISSMSFFFASW